MIRVDTGVVITTRWCYYLFYLQQCFSSLGTVLPNSFTGAFSSNSHLDVREVKAESVRAWSRYFGMEFLWLEIQWKKKRENLDVWLLSSHLKNVLLCWLLCYTSPVNFPESYTKDELNSSRLGFKSVTAPSTFTTLFLPAFLFAGYLPRFI